MPSLRARRTRVSLNGATLELTAKMRMPISDGLFITFMPGTLSHIASSSSVRSPGSPWWVWPVRNAALRVSESWIVSKWKASISGAPPQ